MSKSELVIIFCLAITVTFGLERVRKDVGDSDIVFELPDIVINYVKNDFEYEFEAFKSSQNDYAFQNKRYSELGWVSIGVPHIIKTFTSEGNETLFHFTPEGVAVYVEMLSHSDRVALLMEIKRKYRINATIGQIKSLILDKFECKLRIVVGDIRTVLVGRVEEFREFPLKMHFWAPIGSVERIAFENRLKEETESLDLSFRCELASAGKEVKQNILSVKFDQLTNIGIQEKLFGPANSTYVSRNQLSNIAAETYSSLNIVEEYQMPLSQFSEEFVQEIIKQTATSALQYVSFDDAIASLSKYSLDIEGDLKPDVIKSDMGRIFSVEVVNSSKYIKVNNETSDRNKDSTHVGTNIGGSVGFGDLFSASLSIGVAVDKSDEWKKSRKTLNEQLTELNSDQRSDVEWKIDGDRIIPKSLKVTRLNRGSFSRTLDFSRIKRMTFEAAYKKTISLETNRLIESLNAAIFRMNDVIMEIGHRDVLSWFDANGVGMRLYNGWYICNGKNGTPDLRGKFLVNYNEAESDYNLIGKTGGLKSVQLTVNQLPTHNHEESGHFHSLSLSTTSNGEHKHVYKDIYFSEKNDKGYQDYTYVPYGLGKDGQDYDNGGFEFDRTTNNVENHSHKVLGYTENSKPSLIETGNNEAHTNLPPYSVVYYIIYKG